MESFEHEITEMGMARINTIVMKVVNLLHSESVTRLEVALILLAIRECELVNHKLIEGHKSWLKKDIENYKLATARMRALINEASL